MLEINKDDDFDRESLKPKERLIPDFWENNSLTPPVAQRLEEIANDILESFKIDTKILDVIITGSIASYNWHELSDIDLHIVLDFRKIDDNFSLVKKMLDQSRINWNKTHDILIYNKEVELYFQDINETHESNGVWSLLDQEWVAEPVRLNPNIDLSSAEKKATAVAMSIEHIEETMESDPQTAYDYASKLKKKISNMRKAGLSREGIYSPENLAFKMLRNSDLLGRLSRIKINSYDKKMSLHTTGDLSEVRDYFNNDLSDEYLRFDNHPLSTIENLMNLNAAAPWGETEAELETET